MEQYKTIKRVQDTLTSEFSSHLERNTSLLDFSPLRSGDKIILPSEFHTRERKMKESVDSFIQVEFQVTRGNLEFMKFLSFGQLFGAAIGEKYSQRSRERWEETIARCGTFDIFKVLQHLESGGALRVREVFFPAERKGGSCKGAVYVWEMLPLE